MSGLNMEIIKEMPFPMVPIDLQQKTMKFLKKRLVSQKSLWSQR